MWGKLENPPSSRPILIYSEFRSKPSLITVICMDPHSPNKLIATKYCFLILGDDTSFFFLIILLIYFCFVFCFFFRYFTLLLIFTKIILLLLLFFFNENYCYFLMFRDVPLVPECSMFLGLSIKHFLPWYLFTAVIKHFLPWCLLTAVIKHFLPWYLLTAVMQRAAVKHGIRNPERESRKRKQKRNTESVKEGSKRSIKKKMLAMTIK